jgi:hypothetical protein
MLRRLALSCLTLCVPLWFVGGCASQPPKPKPKRFDVRLLIGSGLAGASVQVDVIGTSARSDLPRLEQYPVSQYWKKDDKLRLESQKKSFVFPPAGAREATLRAADEIWNVWLRSGAEVLMIIADWPGIHTDRPGTSDPRRFIVSIDEREWKGVQTLEILVQESGIKLMTPLPPK